MKIYGLDFTSAPSNKKPITCAEGFFDGSCLKIEKLLDLKSFPMFEAQLVVPGPWVMAIDFPFSMPQRWITAMQWIESWEGYVQYFKTMDKKVFCDLILSYGAEKPKGEKRHFRSVDISADSRSPMQVFGPPPVGRMFFQGAHRVLDSGANIPLLRPNDSERTILEGYPALVVRRFIKKSRSYKSDNRKKHTTDRKHARQDILDGLLSEQLNKIYGFRLQLNLPLNEIEDLVNKPGADQLDAILCAIQAAWSHSRHKTDSGFPAHAHKSKEGWIPDPALL